MDDQKRSATGKMKVVLEEKAMLALWLAAIVESSDDAIVGKNLAGIVTSWNPGAERMFGYPADEMVGKPILTIIPPELHEQEREILEKLKRGEKVDHLETVRRTKDGRMIDVSITASCVKDSAGRIIGASKIARDISERKRAQEALQKLNGELEQRIRDRTAQFEVANSELEAFCYSVSHDLRAPLRAIDGYGRMLVEDYRDRLDAEGQRILDVISSETRRMGQLIDELLAFSRLSRANLEPEDIDMTVLAREVIGEQTSQSSERALQLELKPLPPARGDWAMMRVALGNLLSNALKFTKNRPDAAIEIGGKMESGQAVYYVKDNGAGFDMRYADKLFGVFQRLHTNEEFEGTGVGLALVQRIVLRHGGHVWAEGKVNEGATFYFSLPERKEKP